MLDFLFVLHGLWRCSFAESGESFVQGFSNDLWILGSLALGVFGFITTRAGGRQRLLPLLLGLGSWSQTHFPVHELLRDAIEAIEAEDLIEGLAVGDESGVHQPAPGATQLGYCQWQVLEEALLGVITQTSTIAHSDQEEVECERRGFPAMAQVPMANQAVIDPTKLCWNLA